MIVLHNNRFVKDAKVSATGSITRGFGVFETLRTFGDKKLPFLDLHLSRLESSGRKIGLQLRYKKEKIKKMVEKVTIKSPHKFQRIKIIATKEDFIILSTKGPKEKIFASLKSIQMTRSLPSIKSISYLPSLIANKEAEKAGYTDALLIDEKTKVSECAYANIFWFEGNTLCTRNDSILPGIIRQIILKNSPFKIKFKNIKLKDLKKKEVFITQSINLITPVTIIDGTKIPTSQKTQTLIAYLKTTSHF